MINKISKKLNLTRKKKLVALLSILSITLGGYLLYENRVEAFSKLGFNKVEAYNEVTLANMFTKPASTSSELNANISKMTNELVTWGYSLDDVAFLYDDNFTLVQKNQKLTDYYTQKSEELDNKLAKLQEKADLYELKPEVSSSATTIEKYNYMYELVDAKEIELKNTIKENSKELASNGFTTAQIKALNDDSLVQTIKNQDAKLKVVESWEKSIASESIKVQIMNMFNQTNEYRKSKGLKPYTYNYAKQSCVDTEAKAYAANGNPHNWLCKSAANENAGIASVSSNYVKIAMDFFKSDPPHEAVLSGNYSSVAISFVPSNGRMHMIMDVFK